MVTSRSLPQHTAQIFSPLAIQNLSGLRFSQIGQDTMSRIRCAVEKSKVRKRQRRFTLSLEWHPAGVLSFERKRPTAQQERQKAARTLSRAHAPAETPFQSPEQGIAAATDGDRGAATALATA